MICNLILWLPCLLRHTCTPLYCFQLRHTGTSLFVTTDWPQHFSPKAELLLSRGNTVLHTLHDQQKVPSWTQFTTIQAEHLSFYSDRWTLHNYVLGTHSITMFYYSALQAEHVLSQCSTAGQWTLRSAEHVLSQCFTAGHVHHIGHVPSHLTTSGTLTVTSTRGRTSFVRIGGTSFVTLYYTIYRWNLFRHSTLGRTKCITQHFRQN